MKKENSGKTKDSSSKLVKYWTEQLEEASKREKNWQQEATEYFQVYKNEKKVINSSNGQSERYPVFWSNTQTLMPLIFSKLPSPNIRRRFLDKDDNSRILSEMIERYISFSLERNKTDQIFNKVRNDFLIGGRGLARVIYEAPEIYEIEEEVVDPDSGDVVMDAREEIDNETKRVKIEYINWEDFRLSGENTWEECRWVAFRHKMNRKQLVDEFGEIGNEVQLNYCSLSNPNESKNYEDDSFKLAEVWEIWDKETKRVIFVSSGLNGKILKDEDDGYGLEDFFPIPKPLGSDSDPCSLIPIPLYRFYKAQAAELNRIEERLKSLTEQCKFTGVYASIVEGNDINSFLNGEDGNFDPAKIQPGTSIKDAIFTKPLIEIVTTIRQLREEKNAIIQNIRDITGISDIVRGTTMASETATAQRLKGDFAISRIQPLQKEVEYFIRDLIRLEVELVVENYEVEELAQITGLKIVDINLIEQQARSKQEPLLIEALDQIDPDTPEGQQQIQQLKEQAELGIQKTLEPYLKELKGFSATPEQLQEISILMKDDKLRSFKIDIETDSTVRIDQNQHKADMLEYIQSIAAFSSQMLPVLNTGIINKPAFNEMLASVSKAFKVGRNLEGFLLDQEEEPKGPTLEEQLAQADNQRKDQELELKSKEVDIKQQEVNIKKAQVKQNQIQFEDKIEFEDVNKAADREARTFQELVDTRTERVNEQIRESY